MQSLITAEIARISARIRRWREEEGLTLQELAKRSGVATSTVQKVETGQMIPSVAVLLKLAHGFGRRPTELIRETDTDRDVSHVRASERQRSGHEKSVSVERLSGDLSDPAIEMWRVYVQPGAGSGRAPIRYDGEEVVVCEVGPLLFDIEGVEFRLEAGDTLHFKAHRPHSWRNGGACVVHFTVTGTLPARFRARPRTRPVAE
jgi:transcriptional regulator with XRE-family HTH domain